MPTSFPCPHCHGTTFCGGFERYGTLMTSEACSTCLVKSGLPVKGKFYKVVCSVCGGRGTVTDKPAGHPPGYSQVTWLLLASPLLLTAGFLTAMSIQQWRDRQEEPEQLEEKIEQQARQMTRETPLEDVKAQMLGLTKRQVTARLGEPESTQRLPTPDGTTEVWLYTRYDGRLKLRLQDGQVREASSQ